MTTPDNLPLYPLLFKPIYKEKVWGGRAMESLGRSLPGGDRTPPTLIGESWEIADLASTAPGGGGGNPEHSIISNGPLAGTTLHEAIRRYGERLMGRLASTADGGFPLLVKFLDAQQNLSVQVHPSPAYVRAHEGSVDVHLKSEAWYILDAAPGAAIFKGVRQGVTPEQFRAAITGASGESVESLLIRVPVKKGDCHYLPSGTCHALGAGVLVAEVQTPSDTTFRVYDWGRPQSAGRQLHIEEAMACIEFGPPQVKLNERRSHIAGMFTTVTRLVLCEHFRMEKVRMMGEYEQEIPYDQPAVWIVLSGRGRITPGNGATAVEFSRGQTLLVPANMDDAKVKLLEDTVWVEVTFPRAQPEPIA